VTDAQIKLKRTDSILQELIPEALSQLNDNRLHELDIIEVRCAKGRDDAKVYVDPSFFTEEEKKVYLKQLKKARPIIEDHCKKDQGWFRCPRLVFEFDEHLKKAQTIDELFKKISKDKKDES